MSVLIKNMKMPKNCDECNIRDIHLCKLWMRMTISQRIEGKHLDCPLVEVKEPHGDLVDKDKLMQEVIDSDLDHLQRDDWKEVIQIVSDADVIIKAEGSESCEKHEEVQT